MALCPKQIFLYIEVYKLHAYTFTNLITSDTFKEAYIGII